MIEHNLYQLMSTAENQESADVSSMDYVLNLEVLNKCAHSCVGCFVNRRNSTDDVNLKKALEIAMDMAAKGMRFREVILSPTDIFSAENTLEILKDPIFHKLMRIHPKTRITSTAMFENMDFDKFEEIFSVLDNTDFYKEDMIIEFLVPMNVQKMLSGDQEYLDQHTKALEFLKTKTPKIVDWSFVVNVHYDADFIDNFEELTHIARDDFNTIIEFLPSFFRTGNDILIKEHLETWKLFLSEAITYDNYKNVMLTIADKFHNSINTIVMNYRKSRLYISPFIYEQIIQDNDKFEIGPISADQVFKRSGQMVGEQFKYSTKTDQCADCSYLSTCIGRNVLSFMEDKHIKSCIYPKDVLDMYHNTDPRSDRDVRCKNADKQ